MSDDFTRLNIGSGGDAMDESACSYGSAPLLRKRPRVVLGYDDGTLSEKLATDATLAARFGPISLGVPALVTDAGDTVVYTPTSGKAARLVWLGAFRPDGDSGETSVTVSVTLGGTMIIALAGILGTAVHVFRIAAG